MASAEREPITGSEGIGVRTGTVPPLFVLGVREEFAIIKGDLLR